MAKELPYFKFEPNQWENGNIQICSREEKGLFIDLCAMYWSRLGDVPYKLAVQKLCFGNATALNSLCDEKIIEVLDGNIFIKFLSGQLNEFENTSLQNSKNAKEGWEKRRKQKEESDRNATALIPQCESDGIKENKIKENKIKENKIKENKIPYDEIVGIFNSLCVDLPVVQIISDTRKKKIDAIIKEYSFEQLGEVFKNTAESDFLSGRSDKWKASFDWILEKKNFLKILEGNYKNSLPFLKENNLTKSEKKDELTKLTTEFRNAIPNL